MTLSSLLDRNVARIKSALKHIPADDRDTWLKIGMALHHYFGSDGRGVDLWVDWSMQCPDKYNYRDQKRTWDNFRYDHENPIDLGTLFKLAKDRGWDEEYESYRSKIGPMDLPLAKPIKTGDIAWRALKKLEARYQEWNNQLSAPQWLGLEALATHIEAMANGELRPLYYLSSLDPGIGKTQICILTIQELLESKAHSHVGIVVFVGRLREIETYIQQMNLRDDDYAVLVADTNDEKNKELNGLGNPDKNAARILFTTQQKLESIAKRRGSFETIEEFHFRDKPRQVRIWDEAILPGRTILLNVDRVHKLLESAREYGSDTLHQVLDTFIKDAESKKDQEFIDIPDFETVAGVDLSMAFGIYSEEGNSIRDTVNDLWLLAGKTVIVRQSGRTKDGKPKNIFLDYENTLPDDLKPIVVCDASGRVRQSYSHWSKTRQDLVHLTHATKDYSDLTLHIWRRAGSKTAWKDNPRILVEGIVNTILTKPDEEWLIIHHKQSKKFDKDIPKLVEHALWGTNVDKDKLQFIHWLGEDYRASNDYRDIKNVILAGTLFYEPAYYEAVGRLSRGMASFMRLDSNHYKQIQIGEHAHLILQALCRGSVRNCVNGRCAPCDAYIIAHPRHGITAMLEDEYIFPHAKVVHWSPVEKQLEGRVGEAFNYIVQWFNQFREPLKMSAVYNDMGMQAQDFNKDVVDHPDFEAALALVDIRIDRRRGRGGTQFIKVE